MVARLVSLAVLAVLAAGCAADSSSTAGSGGEPSPTSIAGTAPIAPASFSLEERLEDGPVVLWFWAPGCGTCNSIAAEVERAHQAAAGRVEFIGVSWYGNEDSYRAFVERHGITFTNVSDDDGVLFARFGVPVQPAFAFVATDGTSTTVNGPMSSTEIAERVEELVS